METIESDMSSSYISTSPSSLSAIYFCSLCDKPFTNERSSQRHFDYCRTRKLKRPRSCIACNATKQKCNFQSPCLRCLKRGVDCIYRAGAHHAKPTATSITARHVPNANVENLLAVDPALPESSSCGSMVEGSSSAQPRLLNEGSSFFGLSFFQDYTPNPSSTMVDVSRASLDDISQQAPSWCKWSQGDISPLLNMTNSSLIELNQASGVLPPWSAGRPYAQHNANLIIQALRAFPTMMQRRNTFPWFIHPSAHLLTIHKNTMPEALSTCMSIAHLFASRTTETRPLLWRTIRAEFRGFVKRMHDMSGFDLLAALQACMIYLIMCIVDQSLESAATTIVLLASLNDLYALFKLVCPCWINLSEHSDLGSNWEEWILAESQRRLAHLWFLIGCVICVKTGIPSDPSQSFRFLVLPSPKSLWQASSQAAWRVEYEASLNLQSSGLITLGDLIDAQKSPYSTTDVQKMDKWNAGTDGLGSLLNLVGTML